MKTVKSPFKTTWKFIFISFKYASDRAIFKRKLQKSGIDCSYLNTHNLIITRSVVDYAFICRSLNKDTTISVLNVTDYQFSKMDYIKGV
jgi:hypothetical protein